MAYNTGFQVYKSTALQALDCRPTGQTKMVGGPGDTFTYSTIFVAAEAIEVGECIAMTRVPKGLMVTDVVLYHSANAGATIGVGDPFCCGRFLGPIETTVASGGYFTQAQGVNCGPVTRLSKINRTGDGCGFGYTYTCETDIIITNGYGTNTFQVGGGSAGGGSAVGGGTSAVLASGTVFGLTIEGLIVPLPNA